MVVKKRVVVSVKLDSMQFQVNPVIMYLRDFDSYLIMNHAFCRHNKREHI